jgi:hypothetical protein
MASIAPIPESRETHQVALLPRVGALLLAVLIVAAGIAPVFSRDGDSTILESGTSVETSHAAPANLSDSFSGVSSLARELEKQVEQQQAQAAQAEQAAT